MSEFNPGDLVRVVQNKKPLKLGETLFELVEVDGFYCTVREAGTNYKAQPADTSMFMRVSQ